MPSTAYWNICKITETLLSHCEKHNIQCWIEFGSLIGLKRHNGVIPWDYDGDYGIWGYDKDRFISSFKSEHHDIICNVDYYQDFGCLALHLEGNEDDIVDIVFYEIRQDPVTSKLMLDSMMGRAIKDEYPAANDYCHPADDILPFNKELFLGHTVYVPKNWESVLNVHYPDPKWDIYPDGTTDYMLEWESDTDEYINLEDLRYTSSPFRPLPRYFPKSFAQLRTLVETCKEPFILPDAEFLQCNNYEDIINKQSNPIYGYSSSITWDEEKLPAKEVWEGYKNKKLQFNVVDAPVDNLSVLPTQWNNYVELKLGKHYKFALTWVMTNAPKITHFHVDPEYAGGYMKLLEGEKIWWLIVPEDFKYLKSKGHTVESLAKCTLTEMLQLENSYLFGKIYVDTLESGDMIWFPVDTLHKVITTKDSHGFGGYL